MSGNKPIQRDDQYRASCICPTWPNEVRTDPYYPSVWAMPSNDVPFIIKSGEELPTRPGKPVSLWDQVRGENDKVSHENAIHDVPELHHRDCQRRT